MIKNILILITKGEVGGAQQSVFNLAQGLIQEGKTVTVGFGEGNFLKEKLERAKIPYVNFRYLRRTHNMFANFLFMFELKGFLKKHPCDVVHFNSSNTLCGAMSAHMVHPQPKTIFTFRGLSMLDANYKIFLPIKYVYILFFKFFLRYVDKKIFVSNANYQCAIKEKITLDGEVIYNGIDISHFNFLSKEESQKELSKIIDIDWQNSFMIGSIGRLSYQKNFEFLIGTFLETTKDTPQVKLIIIGNGPEKNKLESLIVDYKLQERVYITGDIPDAAKYIKAFDVFVLPSRYEGLSITLIEALASGLPILATDVGGNRETLDNGGWLYQLDNKDEFVDKMSRLIKHRKDRDALSQEALKKSKDFDIKKTVKAYIKTYSS